MAESGINKNFLLADSLRGSAAVGPHWLRVYTDRRISNRHFGDSPSRIQHSRTDSPVMPDTSSRIARHTDGSARTASASGNAWKLGVKVPALPKDFQMKDHDAAMKNLEGLSGKAFDKAFLQHEVDYHKAVIEAVNTTLMPALQNQEVKDLVT
jgi:hypothetical protein